MEPAIPASEWPQTHSLDRAATGTQLYQRQLCYPKFTVPVDIEMPQIFVDAYRLLREAN
jgi:hypothetical protein